MLTLSTKLVVAIVGALFLARLVFLSCSTIGASLAMHIK